MKHPDLAIIMGRPKAHAPDDDEDDDKAAGDMSSTEHGAAMDDAADEVFDSIKKGDKDSFRKALEAFCTLHAEAPDAEPSKDDMGDEDDDDGEGDHDFRL
jgi:hypothetical protein